MALGRPSKLTPQLVEQVQELSAQGLPIGIICSQVGINHSTAWRWIQDSLQDEDEPESLKARFRKAIDDSGAALAKVQLQNLRNQAADGSTQAATWLLTHHPATREHFSDAAADRRVEKRTMAAVVDAIASSGLPPEQERLLLLNLQARGLGAAPAEPSDADG